MTIQTSRRAFLKGVSQLGVLGAAAPLGLGLSSATRLANAANVGSYKALVCIFLYGGNDSPNTIIPYDMDHYTRYANARSHVAVPRQDLTGTVLNPSNSFGGGRSFALHPNLKDLKNIFEEGKLSLLMNVGTLIQPTNLRDYNQGLNLPPKLMSHNDQFSLWQSLQAEGSQSGWGGRMGDIFAESNGPAKLITNISVGSTANFSAGASSVEYSMGVSGPIDIAADNDYQNADIINLIERNIATSDPHLIHQELNRKYRHLTKGSKIIRKALSSSTSYYDSEEPIGKSLEMVARIIGGNNATGAKRQIFFVGMGGFDSHSSLNSGHPELLATLGKEMSRFQNNIDSLGLSEQVTTFTASDFGRSLTSNGRGSDHGWGGHHFIMGGAVKNKSWAGSLPSFEKNGNDDVGGGRLLPSVSVDQYGATLAKWMGLNDSELSDVFPNIGNFNKKDLGFLG